MVIKLKRAYDTAVSDDGYRVLVDRLWPRGITKEKAKIDLWLKDIAPTNDLRRWFGHDPDRWPEFELKYRTELANNEGLLKELKKLESTNKTITLVYAAKDETRNNAVVLKRKLEGGD